MSLEEKAKSKSFNTQFSTPRSKWDRCAKRNIQNANDSFDEISIKNFIQIQVKNNSCESQSIKSGVLLDIFSEITEFGYGIWLL